MRIKIDKNRLKDLKTILGVVNKFREEIFIEFKNYGLRIKDNDKSMVCLFDLKIFKEQFDEWDLNQEFERAINLSNFLIFLKNFKDYVIIEQKENNLILYDDKQKYSLPFLDLDKNELPNVEGMTWILKTSINFMDLVNYINAFDSVSDYIILENKNQTLKALCEDNEGFLTKTYTAENIKSKYPIEYLIKLKTLKNFECDLYLNKNYPLKLILKKDYIKFMFILAPRVDEE